MYARGRSRSRRYGIRLALRAIRRFRGAFRRRYGRRRF